MSLYRRGKYFWYGFVWEGRRIQGPTKVADRKVARDIEAAVRVKLAKGEHGLVTEPKPNLTLKQMFDDLEEAFKNGKRRGPWSPRQQSNFKVARAAFPELLKASALTKADIDRYVAKRRKQKRRNATINRALLILASAYRLAKITPPTDIPHFSERDNARKGFFEADQFARVLEHLPEDLKDYARFGYLSGWRKGEIASLVWDNLEGNKIKFPAEHLELPGDEIKLPGDQSKNEDPRSIPVEGELLEILKRRRRAQIYKGRFVTFIFHRDGARIQEFRKSWATACANAKVPDRKFHDLRRTAVRNLTRAHVPRAIAMGITGHRSEAVYRRYDIVDPDDKRKALRDVQEYLDANAAKVVAIV
jgi:integrase